MKGSFFAYLLAFTLCLCQYISANENFGTPETDGFFPVNVVKSNFEENSEPCISLIDKSILENGLSSYLQNLLSVTFFVSQYERKHEATQSVPFDSQGGASDKSPSSDSADGSSSSSSPSDSGKYGNIPDSDKNGDAISVPEQPAEKNKVDVKKDVNFPSYGSSLKRADFAKIIDRMRIVNLGLKDYVSPFDISVKAKYTFLEIPFNIEGNYYFKEPDLHKVTFVKAPDFLGRYPQAFGWSLPDPSKYTVKIFEGGEGFTDCFMLRMVPIEGRGDLEKIDLWVDKNTWLFPRQIYSYRNGGEVDLLCHYRSIEGFKLFDKIDFKILFPFIGIQATGEVVYGDYYINKGIAEEMFEK